MKELKAVIIDDEEHCVRTLKWELEQLEGITVLASTNDPEEGIRLISERTPDIVFLDIEMPGMTGFDLLERLDHFNFNLIFTTAYDEFAIKAFEANASDYLMKPIGEEKLRKSIEQIRNRDEVFSNQQLQDLLKTIRTDLQKHRKVALPMSDGMEFVPSDEIIYCQSDSNYTYLFLTSGRKMLVSKTLKDIEEVLKSFNFLRVHKSYLVNPIHISKYVRAGGGYLIMDNEHEVNIGKSRKEEVLALLSNL